MTTNPHNPNSSKFANGSAEETLRIVASLPAPAGLEDRVHTTLRDAHHRNLRPGMDGAEADRRGRVLAWPTALKPQSSWMRTAAAAAIVFVVVGGGWGVYTRVEQNLPAKVLIMPPRVGAQGGFSSAGAIRTPQTIPGPVAPQTPQAKAAKKSSAKAAPQAASKSNVKSEPAAQQ
jgi:hypothetical protein